jgi:cysteine desulfurase/selenocysteine lyase
MTFNSAEFKQAFPLFSHPENENLVYLDNAATTQRPQAVIDAIADFYGRYNANTHRSSHRLARAATEMVERVRQQLAEFIHAKTPNEIIFTRGATEALNLLASSIGETLNAGDEIILSAAEHHANMVPWQMLAEKKNLVLRFLPDDNGLPKLSALSELLNKKTKVVSLTAASNALGFCLPIETIKSQLPSDCVFIVDASQRLAHDTIDVVKVNCDFLVGSAHKFYGPTGIGFLYGKATLLNTLPPWQGGGEMIKVVELSGSQFASSPHRFEAGTSALAAIAGLGACLAFLDSIDRQSLALYEHHLTRYLHTELSALCQGLPLRLLTRFEGNVGIAALAPTSDSSASAMDIATWLDGSDIAVRVGNHCAQPLMRQIGESGSLRVSLAGYNNRDDIDRLVAAIKSVPAFGAQVVVVDTVPTMSDLWRMAELEGLDIADLQQQNSWQKRYRQLTRWADILRPQPTIREQTNQVHGCETDVWMIHRQIDGLNQFAFDADSRVIKGLIVLLLLLVNNRSSTTIRQLDFPRIFSDLGLEKYMSPSRSNGFKSLVDQILLSIGDEEKT